MASQISVPYSMLPGDDTITESWDPDNGPTATIVFKCLWRDRYQLVKDLVGTYAGTPPRTITRVAPFPYPPSPNLICTAIQEIRPAGKLIPWPTIGLPWMSRKYAHVTAVFTVPKWLTTGNDAYTKVTFGASGEFLTIPETTTYFADGTPTNTPIGILMPQMEITVERNRMPFLPIASMLQCEGKINNAPFQILGVPFDTGKLVFMTGQSDFQVDATGQIAYSQEYKFIARPVNWNYYLHPNGTTGFAPVADLSGNLPYGSQDFTILP